MALEIGTRLGSYEIQAAIGAGGMGEVYRARDTRLNRDVAIKVLPDVFALDPDRLARFEREAQLLASLNHPNIAGIYGVEEGPAKAGHDVRALVLELVEGPTLADRIANGPLPLDEAVRIARQIAEALAAAHEQGVIHRDLKPANIKVREDGTVKVLDFGLAKALGPAEAGHYVQDGRSVRLTRPERSRGQPDLTASPTITSPAMMTGVGVILGTAAYMSPEQAKGREADKRSDIWAFGCVLYEMLTGTRAFDGEDMVDVLGAVARLEPKWEALSPDVPPPVRTLLQSCLVKDRRHRVADISTALFVLEKSASLAATSHAHDGHGPAEAGHYVRSTRRRVAIVGAAAAAAGALMAAGGAWWTLRPVPPRMVRTEVTTSGTTVFNPQGIDRDLAITPDGSRVVYRGNNQLIVRTLDRLEPEILSGLGAPRGVFVSPDGQWVGFFDGTSLLKKVAITGGPAVTIAPADGSGARGATWGPDGSIIFATNAPTGLQRVSAAGGDPAVLTKPNRERGEGDHLWPEFLPGGQAVLFTIAPVTGGLEGAQIAVLELKTGTYKVLVRGGSYAHYVSTGHLVYGAGGTLRAVAFDPGRLEVSGVPVPVLEGVATTPNGAVEMAAAANGTMVYVPGRVGGAVRSLVWVDRMGREEPLAAPMRAYQYLRISPDGTRVALDIRDQEQDIWIWDFARQTLTRFTFDAAQDQYAVWSPDSRRLVFGSARAGGFNLFWQAADGTGVVERLTESQATQYPLSVTPDGSRIIFREDNQGNDLMVMPLQAPRRPQPLIQTMFGERNGEVSPDGHWLAYESNESGREEIYVRPFPDVGGGRWQVSTAGGRIPLWSRNGQELFYVSPDSALMAVKVDAATSWRSGTPAPIVKGQYFYAAAGNGRTYDISPDGRRFLMINERGSGATPQNLVVVQNWFEELKRLVPVN